MKSLKYALLASVLMLACSPRNNPLNSAGRQGSPVGSLSQQISQRGAATPLLRSPVALNNRGEMLTVVGGNINAQREPLSLIMGDPPNFGASSNGEMLTVVSGPTGRGAKTGALVELLYPDLGEDHLWDAYSGVAYNNKMIWLHDMETLEQRLDPGSDIVVSRFRTRDKALEVQTEDLVHRQDNIHTRLLTVRNTSDQPLEITGFFYENLSVNLYPTGDRCAYVEAEGALHHYENRVHFAVGLDEAPQQFQCGGVKNFITNAQDAMHDANDGKLHMNPTSSAGAGLGVNGALAGKSVTLAPGETYRQRSFLAAGASQAEAFGGLRKARNSSWQALAEGNVNSWQQFLRTARIPSGLTADERRVYERALIVMKQHSARTGAHLAGPTNTSPPYRFSWPRDGSFIALAHLQSGHAEETRAFLDFMAANQKENGSWAINYHTNGQAFYDFGDRGNEHDQVGTLPWMMVYYAEKTGQWDWVRSKWPTIQRACDYLISKQDQATGLLGPTRDLWELSTSDSWTYSNAAGYAGFKAAEKLALRFNDTRRAERYAQAAAAVKQGIETYLWNEEEGYFVRGYHLNKKRQDMKVEAANLALVYPFQVFAPDDPRMQAMARKIDQTLRSDRGGIRRYTNDRYYDGQPWPVTTEWLSIYYSLAGNMQRARALHDTTTGYALTTPSQQLGEQYDEKRGRWVSALPLTWSGAKYILAAQHLTGEVL